MVHQEVNARDALYEFHLGFAIMLAWILNNGFAASDVGSAPVSHAAGSLSHRLGLSFLKLGGTTFLLLIAFAAKAAQ